MEISDFVGSGRGDTCNTKSYETAKEVHRFPNLEFLLTVDYWAIRQIPTDAKRFGLCMVSELQIRTTTT